MLNLEGEKMTVKQKKQIESRINWIASHSYNPVLAAEMEGIEFSLKVLGYFASYEYGEYKILKAN